MLLFLDQKVYDEAVLKGLIEGSKSYQPPKLIQGNTSSYTDTYNSYNTYNNYSVPTFGYSYNYSPFYY